MKGGCGRSYGTCGEIMGELSTAQLLTAHPQFHHTTPTSVGKIQQQVNSLASVRLIMRQRMDLKGFPSVRFYFEATGARVASQKT